MNLVVQRFAQSWILKRYQWSVSRDQAEQRYVYGDHSNQTGDASQKARSREREFIGSGIQVWHNKPVMINPVHAKDEDSRNCQQDFVSSQATTHQQKEWNEQVTN